MGGGGLGVITNCDHWRAEAEHENGGAL